MENKLNRLLHWIPVIIRKLFGFGVFAKKQLVAGDRAQEEMVKLISQAEDAIYETIVARLKDDPSIHKYGPDVRLLYRRLDQYERMRNHASLADLHKALQKLDKQFRKVERNSERLNHPKEIRIIPKPAAG